MGLLAYLNADPDCRNLAEGAIHAAAPLLADPDPAPTLARLDTWAFQLAGRMPLPWNLHAAIDALNAFLFQEQGLHGDATAYDDPANAVLPLVLERRRGLPITLAILWMDLAHRMGFQPVGIPLPGHFITGLRLDMGVLCFDPFHGGRPVGEAEAAELVRLATRGQIAFERSMMSPTTHRAILTRLVRNLYVRFAKAQAWDDALWSASHLVLLGPADSQAYRERAFVHLQRNELREAIEDLQQALALVGHPDEDLEAWLRDALARRGEGHGSAQIP